MPRILCLCFLLGCLLIQLFCFLPLDIYVFDLWCCIYHCNCCCTCCSMSSTIIMSSWLCDSHCCHDWVVINNLKKEKQEKHTKQKQKITKKNNSEQKTRRQQKAKYKWNHILSALISFFVIISYVQNIADVCHAHE